MRTTSATPPADRQRLAAGIAARAAQIGVTFILLAAVLFLSAGRADWGWAWGYLGISIVSVLANAAAMLRRSPETVAERGRPGEATQGWDKALSGLWAAAQYLALPLVAGLDQRFGWTQAAGGWHWAGAAAYAAGLALSGWAMVENAFFSTAVRIQRERGHTVCRSGPYRLVRHPGYLGFCLSALALPALLGSRWALLPALASVALMVTRAALEDRMLLAELPGYREYARDVRYRLLPGVW